MIEDALLDAIRADPSDGPRLVYADWLDEHDRPERAEVIRVGLRLAVRGLDSKEKTRLGKRHRKLIDEHAGEWLGPLTDWGWRRYGMSGWWFDRGMPGLSVTPRTFVGKAFQAGAGEWMRRAGVQTLVLSGDSKQWTAIACSPILSVVPELRVEDCTSLGDAEAVALARSPHLAGLRELWLGQTRIGAAGVRALAYSKHLTNLSGFGVTGNARAGAGVTHLVKSPLWKRLMTLELGGAGIGLAELKQILRALPKSKITRLDLGLNRLDADACRRIADCPASAALTALDLSLCDVDDAGARALAGSAHLANLRDLDLGFAQLGPDGVKALINSPHLGNLTTLVMACAEMPAGAQAALRKRYGKALDMQG